jgi:hypothetical protein
MTKQLAGVGFDQVERISIADLDLSSPDLRRRTAPAAGGSIEPIGFREVAAARQATAAPSGQAAAMPAGQADAHDLITRAVAAKGGADVLRSIRTSKIQATTLVHAGDSQTEFASTTFIRYPGAFRSESQLPGGRLVQVFSAGAAWFQDPAGLHDAPPAMLDQMRSAVQRDVVPLLLALADGRLSARRIPDVTEASRRLPALEVALPGGSPLTLVFDPVTALIVKARYSVNASGSDGAAAHAEESYSDYRDVHGLKVAFATELRRDGAPALSRTLRSYEINVPIDPVLFVKPS